MIEHFLGISWCELLLVVLACYGFAWLFTQAGYRIDWRGPKYPPGGLV